MDKGFLYISLALFAVILYGLSLWLRLKFTKKKMHRLYFIVPIVIILAITTILMSKTKWDVENINIRYNRKHQEALNTKWYVVENQLNILQKESFDNAEYMATQIVKSLSVYSPGELDEALSVIPSHNNIIQVTTDSVLREGYFRGIMKDANSPFALLIGHDINDSFIYSSFSRNSELSWEDFMGTMEQEYALASINNNNRELMEYTFGKLIMLDTGEPLFNSLFCQFDSRDIPLNPPYTLAMLKDLFMETNGNIHLTFDGIKFYAPYYIFRDYAISGTPRVLNRIKTDAKIVAVVSSFNYEDILERDDLFKLQIEQMDRSIEMLHNQKVLEERAVLIVGLMLMTVIFVLLILFWVFTHFSYELLD